jgi:phosphatidylglycerophosphatase A
MKYIATLGPIGYLPASGTWASALTILFIYVLRLFNISRMAYSGIMCASIILAWYAIRTSKPYFKNHDPREIVIDEVVGCLIAFWCVPLSWLNAVIGFGLFRFFDITKILGISWLERQGQVAGILLDDIGAGVLSNILLRFLLWLVVLA